MKRIVKNKGDESAYIYTNCYDLRKKPHEWGVIMFNKGWVIVLDKKNNVTECMPMDECQQIQIRKGGD